MLELMIFGAALIEPDQSCRAGLDALISKSERIYAGHAIEITGTNREAAYDTMKSALRTKASATGVADCHYVFREYVDYFDDPHFFLLERPEGPATQSFGRLSSDFLQSRLDQDDLNTIEGHWITPKGEVAIVSLDENNFVAASLEPDALGQIEARLHKQGTDWEVVTLSKGGNPIRTRATVQRDAFLHIPPGTWARKELQGYNKLVIDPAKPRAPGYASIGRNSAILSIPSFDFPYRQDIADLVSNNSDEIAALDLLIIDIRGNEGGSSLLDEHIRPFYRNRQPTSEKSGPMVFLASDEIARCYQPMIENMPEGTEKKENLEFLANVRREAGTIMEWPGGQDTKPDAPEPAGPAPKHIVYLMDEHVVSAAEAITLRARNYGNVTLAGRNSRGSIDYMNVCITAVGEGPLKHLLGFPSFAASADLPKGGFNKTGVPVDLEIDLDTVEPIAFLVERYGRVETP